MIVPDKKTEARLNKRVEQKDIVLLCRSGLLPSADFLRACALCRSDPEWLIISRRILAVFAGVGFVFAFLFCVISGWRFFYTPSASVLLAVLFAFCAVSRRFAAAEYAGAGCVALLVFLPDLIFGTPVRLHEQLFLLSFLLCLWAVPSERAGIRLLPLITLNVAAGAFGACVALPVFHIAPAFFCVTAAIANILLLTGREYSVSRTSLFLSPVFRLVPLFFACLFLSAAGAVRIFENGFSVFAFCFAFAFFAMWFYRFKRSDLRAGRLLLFFSLFWVALIVCGAIGTQGVSSPAGRAVLLCSVSFLIGLAVVLNAVLFSGERQADDDE